MPPRATYRLQFTPSFGFRAAKEIVPYLMELGISDIYASPIFKAKKGSLHGYDIVDQNILNPDLGTPEEFEALVKDLKSRGMGWLQDIVPNHMSYSHENLMLSDVLERGSKSEYFQFFDVDWGHTWEGLKDRVLAPFLGDLYGKTLEQGEIKLVYDEAGFAVSYYDVRMPLRLRSYAKVLSQGLESLQRLPGENNSDLIELKEIILEANGENPCQSLKKRLWDIYSRSNYIKRFVDSNVGSFNGYKGDTESFNMLDDLLVEQLFRLSFWKVASDDINYRRFFIVNDLICLRTEREDAFNHVHSLVFDLVEKGSISGLRIDHLDGLHDPAEYLRRVSRRIKDRYLVAEKILLPGEDLPSDWPLHGTTGYDFLNCMNGILCDKGRKEEFDGIYSRFIGSNVSYEDIVYEKKKLIADRHMSGDVDNLARLLKNALDKDRHGRDITFSGIKKALIELLVLFPVYRTYISPEIFSEKDHAAIAEASRRAKDRNLDLFNEIDFVERFLLEHKWKAGENSLQFVMRFQQFTGPLMAKGSEDTALYVYYRLLSLNEVGGGPSGFGVSLDEFHRFNDTRARDWPDTMNATSTHDTKRGEDARARINVLSEIPEEWERQIEKWSRCNEGCKKKVNGRDVPDRNDEYFLYQALIGSIPFYFEAGFRDRIKNYLVKAVREAKVHSGWVRPDTSYEEAFAAFLEEILDCEEFSKEFLPFQRKVAYYGILNSLTQTIAKITSPGIPDFYQGRELWDFCFVDPDNRQPVDFEKRISYQKEIAEREKTDIMGLIAELLASRKDGRIKLFLIHRALLARKENSDLFAGGAYMRLDVEGEYKENVIAFARKHEGIWALTAAPRLAVTLVEEGELPLGRGIWKDTNLLMNRNAPRSWRNAITDQTLKTEDRIYLGDVLEHFPVALLLGLEET